MKGLVLLVLGGLVASACGTRVDREVIDAVARGGGGTVGQPAADGSAAEPAQQPGRGAPDTGSVQERGTAASESREQTAPTGQDGAGGLPRTGSQRDGGQTEDRAGSTSEGGAPQPEDQTGEAEDTGTTQSAGTAEPIRIGSVGNYSGPTGTTMKPGAEALRIWARAINEAGGLGGRPVEVIVRDDGSDPARHQSIIKDLVENQGVVAFAAQMAPFTVAASRNYLESVQVPVVGGECSHPSWDTSPMLFPQCASYEDGIYAHVDIVSRFGEGKRFGALTCVEAESCTEIARLWFDEGQAEDAGIDPVYHSEISIAQPDFTAECLEAQNNDVEVLSVVADVNTVARVARACDRQGYNPQFEQGGGTTNARIASMPQFDRTLVQTNVFPHLDTDTPATREFHDAFDRYAPETDLQASHALGWAAAKLLEQAVENAGGDAGSSEQILEGLWQTEDETLGGLVTPLTYVEGEPPPHRNCYFWMKIQGDQFTAPNGVEPLCRD